MGKGQSDYTKLTAALPSHMASKATVRVDSLISQKRKKYQRIHMGSFLRLNLQEGASFLLARTQAHVYPSSKEC